MLTIYPSVLLRRMDRNWQESAPDPCQSFILLRGDWFFQPNGHCPRDNVHLTFQDGIIRLEPDLGFSV